MMHSRRSMIDIIQTWPKLREIRRKQMAMDLYGARYQQIDVDEIRRRVPALTGGGPKSRLPILAGMVHPEAAVNRHDSVAWGYARAADALGVEIHQHTGVKSLLQDETGSVCGVETNRGSIRAGKVALAVSGHTTTLTDTIQLKLPLRTFNLSAFVSEPVKPVLDVVVNCPDLGVYLSQTDKGELVIGGGTDPGQSFARGIKQSTFELTVSPLLELFPSFKRLKLLRQWGGHLDMAHDASPIISRTGGSRTLHNRRVVGRLQGHTCRRAFLCPPCPQPANRTRLPRALRWTGSNGWTSFLKQERLCSPRSTCW